MPTKRIADPSVSERLHHAMTRRGFVAAAAGGMALASAPAFGQGDQAGGVGSPDPLDRLPELDPALAREVVGKSHFDYDAVKKLVETRPELAKSSIDWGFGDWECALGAASHTGRRNIVELLLANGARMNLFTAAMLGHLEYVKAAVAASPGTQQVHGPHGLTLMHHARMGKEQAVPVVAYLQSLGDADLGYTIEPLEESQIAAICGEYSYGSGPGQRFEIKMHKGQIRFAREGYAGRQLFHQGGLVFHPAGAPSVRLVFGVESGVAQRVSLGVREPALVARRLG